MNLKTLAILGIIFNILSPLLVFIPINIILGLKLKELNRTPQWIFAIICVIPLCGLIASIWTLVDESK
ncbi:hypothetical protein [[Mycoplasma] anseris]|uniref:Superinfection immunity protein n=1 Tax=[Mycoplasma] anseris TaxID=92400 RepID=A0A2Z4ND80_9BACT|nr:hypothetical protein [[Mycoplasma] anseris]AWX69456.1 hypothetical protein DP065_01655 [[Mycoplasma] anseris]